MGGLPQGLGSLLERHPRDNMMDARRCYCFRKAAVELPALQTEEASMSTRLVGSRWVTLGLCLLDVAFIHCMIPQTHASVITHLFRYYRYYLMHKPDGKIQLSGTGVVEMFCDSPDLSNVCRAG